MTSLTCTVRAPSESTPSELQQFQELVEEGGEVTRSGLHDRILTATALAYLFDGQTLVGVAGLKRPTKGHRAKVIASSGVALTEQDFPYELGWIYIQSRARGRRGTPMLVYGLLARIGGIGVYATSASDKDTIHYWLGQAGFSREGEPYVSGKREIFVFVRPPSKQEEGKNGMRADREQVSQGEGDKAKLTYVRCNRMISGR